MFCTAWNIRISWNSGLWQLSRLEYIPKSCFVRHETCRISWNSGFWQYSKFEQSMWTVNIIWRNLKSGKSGFSKQYVSHSYIHFGTIFHEMHETLTILQLDDYRLPLDVKLTHFLSNYLSLSIGETLSWLLMNTDC